MKKRTVLLLLLLATNIMTFAQDDEYAATYGQRSSSGINGWMIFCSIVIFVFAVLQIILFFKVWGMTDDVKKLKQKFVETEKPDTNEYISHKVMLLHLEGKDEEAFDFLNHNLYNRLIPYISQICQLIQSDSYKIKIKDGECYGGYYEPKNNLSKLFEERKKRKIESLEVYYHKIGKEIPSYLKDLTFMSFYSFNKEE
jgi:hypothetical protein